MSRHKSEATIQLERDRAIRKERLERKRKEHEVKREARLKKRLTHESVVRNGVPKVQPSESRFGLREAMEHSPLMWCESCDCIVREREMVGNICEQCYHSTEGRVNDDKDEGLKAKTNRAVPGKGDGGSGTIALAGQLSLPV
jgi:hypothetical protein